MELMFEMILIKSAETDEALFDKSKQATPVQLQVILVLKSVVMHWILDRISEMMVILFQATAEAQLANLNLLDLPVLRSHFRLYALRNEEMELILEIISEMTEI